MQAIDKSADKFFNLSGLFLYIQSKYAVYGY